MAAEKTIILIGGAPTTGKSTLARALSAHLGLPWISTDQIRAVMKSVARAEDFPHLHNATGHTAETFLTTFSVEDIARMEMEQGHDTWVGIKAFIEGDSTWRQGFIIEGVNILPALVARDFKDHKNIKPLFLVDDNEDRTRKVVFTRGLWDDADKYPDTHKEKEVQWALLFGRQLRAAADEYKYPVLEINKNDNDLKTALGLLGL